MIHKWRLELNFDGKSRPAAQASFVLRPSECPFAGWWLEDVQVRMRYRGAGFEEKLIGMAEEILAHGGYKLHCGSANRKTGYYYRKNCTESF